MKLVIVSHTPHYLQDSQIVGWGATVREIDYLAELFEEVIHIAPLHKEPPPNSSRPYANSKVRIRPVRPAGGEGLSAKLAILFAYPEYAQAFREEFSNADVVHIRCPANISMLAVGLLPLLKAPAKRWIKYAGNWSTYAQEPSSYRLQRWLIHRGWHSAKVTVNGQWSGMPDFITSFLNPCLTDDELRAGRVSSSKKDPTQGLRCLFVGRVEEEKGVGRLLEIAALVRAANIHVQMDIVGNGPDLTRFKDQAERLGLGEVTLFHGWLRREELNRLYELAHFIILPSTCSEGWPKVLSEGMAFGAVPITSTVGAIPGILRQLGVGYAFPPKDLTSFARVISGLHSDRAEWQNQSLVCVDVSRKFSYGSYLEAVRNLLSLPQV